MADKMYPNVWFGVICENIDLEYKARKSQLQVALVYKIYTVAPFV